MPLQSVRSKERIIENISEFEERYRKSYGLSIISGSGILVGEMIRSDSLLDNSESLDNRVRLMAKLIESPAATEIREQRKAIYGMSVDHLRRLSAIDVLLNHFYTVFDDDSISFEKGSIKERIYEHKPWITHLWLGEFMLPRGAPLESHYEFMLHDGPEDNPAIEIMLKQYKYEHKIGKKNIGKQDKELFNSVTGEALSEKFDINQYERVLDRVTDDILALVNFDNGLDPVFISNLKLELLVSTKPFSMVYPEFINGFSKGLDLQNDDDLNLLYRRIVFRKIPDRSLNSRFNPAMENVSDFRKGGSKWLKDAYQSLEILEYSAEFSILLNNMGKLVDKPYGDLQRGEFSGQEFSIFQDGMAALINRNMDLLLGYMRKTYWYLNPAFNLIENKAEGYFFIDGFGKLDEKAGHWWNPFELRGTKKLLTEFAADRIDLFSNLRNPVQVLKLYSTALVSKVLSCLYLSHYPFVERKTLIGPRVLLNSKDTYGTGTLGRYEMSLNNFHILNSYTLLPQAR